MSRDPFAGKANRLTQLSRSVLASDTTGEVDNNTWQTIAEDCVLTRIDTIRILGGLPLHQEPLSQGDRRARLKALLGYWANGCPFVVDESLFADILRRRRLKPAG
ncbi:hypothetical protein [Roseibium sp.]|uniref:hypothetical protein n=1 Tax=Roseibium sp. TaxID=1936156 RepID=UPI003A981572